MNKTPLTLQQIVRLAADNHGASGGQDLERITEKMGQKISRTMWNALLKGTYNKQLRDDNLDLIAKLSGITPAEVYKAASKPYGHTSLGTQLPDGANALPPEDRSAVISLVARLVHKNEELYELRNRNAQLQQENEHLRERIAEQTTSSSGGVESEQKTRGLVAPGTRAVVDLDFDLVDSYAESKTSTAEEDAVASAETTLLAEQKRLQREQSKQGEGER